MDPRECLCRLRNCPSFQNLKVIHQGIEYEIERLLLSSVSPVFCRMLIDDPSVREIQVPSVPGDFSEFVELLYGGNVRIHADNCRFLYFLASFFDILSLKESAAKVMRETNFLFEMIPFIESLIANNLPCNDLVTQIAQNVQVCKDSVFFTNVSWELVSMIADHPDAAGHREDFLKAVIARNPGRYELYEQKDKPEQKGAVFSTTEDPKNGLAFKVRDPLRQQGGCGAS